MPNADRFGDLWHRLGASGSWQPIYDRLVERYREPHRAYHTLDHVAECLCLLDTHRLLAGGPTLIEWALWRHDECYDPSAPRFQNEVTSAEWSASDLRTGSVEEPLIRKASEYILCTAHHPSFPPVGDGRLVADIDRAVLGASWRDYERYMLGIEREYRYQDAISELQYVRRRQAIFLIPTLAMKRIFHIDEFHARLDGSARRNMEQELSLLRQRERILTSR